MKNASLIIQSILAVAIIALFILFFNLKKTVAPILPGAEPMDTVAVEEKNLSVDSILNNSRVLNFPIAFVNIDSIAANFEYYIQKKEGLQKSIEYKTRELSAKEEAINKDYNKVAKSIQDGTTNLITQEDLANTERGFQKRFENLMAEKQNFEKKIMEDDLKLSQEINQSINDFLIKYKEKLNYSYVLQKGAGAGALLYANDSLDITKDVLKALNVEYSSKTKTK